MRSHTRLGALPLAACASLFLFPTLTGLSEPAAAADVGEEAPIEDIDYDYGDEDYVPPSPVYLAARRAVIARGLGSDDLSSDELGGRVSIAAGADLEQLYDITLTRLEIEVGYFSQTNTGSNGVRDDHSSVTGFVSLYRDLGEFYSIRPYVGAGVGMASVSSDAATTSSDDTIGIAWHTTAGLSIDWSESATIDLGYRYTGIEGLDIRSASSAHDIDRMETHAVFTGLRFRL